MKKETKISDRVALSIRGLWNIESLDEKKKLIARYDQIHKAILVFKNHPEAFSEKQRNYIKKLQSQITETDEKIMSEVFLALHLGVVVDPPSYTVEDIKELSKDGIFFTKEELEDILDWQFSPSNKKHDPELVVFVSEQLDNHFYFETIEEAEATSE